MRLQHKIVGGLVAVFVVLVGAAGAAAKLVIAPQFERLEAEHHARAISQIQETIATLHEEMRARVRDYANWDDAYAFINGRKPRFPEENFTADWYANYAIDVALFLDADSEIAWSGSVDGAPDAELTGKLISAWRSAPRRANDAATGVIWAKDGAYVYAAARGTNSDATAPERGLVVFARRIDRATLERQMQIPLQLLERSTQSLDPETGLHLRLLIESNEDFRSWRADDQMHTLIALRNSAGALSAAIKLDRPREINALGAHAILISLLVTAAVFAIVFAAVWIGLRRLILAPVAALEQHLKAQQGDALTPLETPARDDEIGALTNAYNALALSLRQSIEAERAAREESVAAQEANTMKSVFLANLTHELRTPLNAIIGYAELIAEDADDDARRDLERITGSARHLISLVNEILDLSRIESGHMEMRPHTFAVDTLVRSVERAVRAIADANGDVLEIEIESEIGEACTDEARLRQALVNVLGNACKFTRGGRVSLEARRRMREGRDELEFVIRDTGIGMTPAELSRVFEPFVQGQSRQARSFGGAGLGLALTRKIVRLLGGEVSAESVSGQGSVFTIVTPTLLPEIASDTRAA